MRQNNVFKDWVPNWTIKIILILCMTPTMILLGLYNTNVSYAASFLDVEVEDMQYIMCITYGALVATTLIEGRFFRYFTTRNYLLAIFFLTAVVLTLSAFTHRFIFLILLRIAEGILMALPGVWLRLLLLSRFQSRNALIVVYSIFYGILLGSAAFTSNVFVWVLDRFDWRYMTIGAALLQFIPMGLILLTFNSNRFVRKLPLYQFDWISYVLILCALLAGAYVFVYGEKKYWFQSSNIQIATVLTLISTGLFLFKQQHMKRPTFNLAILKSVNLRIGVLLLIFFYIVRSTLNMCHSTMSRIWGWELAHVAHIQYLNLGGLVLGLIIGGWMLARQAPVRYILAIGFSLLAAYLFWFTFLFVPDVSLEQIAIPYILQGVGVGVLFTPLVLFTTSGVDSSLAGFAGICGIASRFTGTVLGFSITQNAQVILDRKHYLKLQQWASPENNEAQDRITSYTASFISKGYTPDQAGHLAISQLNSAITKQSILLSNMEIFTAFGVILVILIIFLLLSHSLRQTFNIWRNKVFFY